MSTPVERWHETGDQQMIVTRAHMGRKKQSHHRLGFPTPGSNMLIASVPFICHVIEHWLIQEQNIPVSNLKISHDR
jgi:hypothetical protein